MSLTIPTLNSVLAEGNVISVYLGVDRNGAQTLTGTIRSYRRITHDSSETLSLRFRVSPSETPELFLSASANLKHGKGIRIVGSLTKGNVIMCEHIEYKPLPPK